MSGSQALFLFSHKLVGMKVALFGYGKMGRIIEKILLERGHTITAKVNRDLPKEKVDLSDTDVVIEFSVPDIAAENIRYCLENDVPVVVGTTGWYDKLGELSEFCTTKSGAFLYATNFSLGVNLFFAVNRYLAGLMNQYAEYDAEITEIHHTQKLDSPSGTAISLAEQIIDRIDRYDHWKNVKKTEISSPETLSVESVRLPDVPGTHTITYNSDIDSLEIKHTAHNRKGFALGSVFAAEWLVGKKGVFTMKDVLNL